MGFPLVRYALNLYSAHPTSNACLDSVAILKFHPLNTGPISLVVTSKAIPLTPHIHSVLHKLSSASVSVSIFVHLLHPDPTSRAESPNAYLNLARLFAPTTHVLLLPGNLSVPPPPLHSLPPSPRLSVITNTAINTTTANTEFPFHAPLALLTRADHPTWCTERAAAAHVAHDPRVLEWDLCVWQFWLGAFGDVGVVQAPAEKGAQGEEGRMGFAMVGIVISVVLFCGCSADWDCLCSANCTSARASSTEPRHAFLQANAFWRWALLTRRARMVSRMPSG